MSLTSRILKIIEFTSDHDIIVEWILINLNLVDGRFERTITNSTGYPSDPNIVFTDRLGNVTKPTADFQRHPLRPDAWRVQIAGNLENGPYRIEFSFASQKGAILSQQEMQKVLQSGAPGPLRREGFEFASISADAPVELCQLLLILHRGLNAGVPELRVYNNEDQHFPVEMEDLKDGLLKIGPNRYSLTIWYPRQDWWYSLAWRPPQAWTPQ